MRYTFPIRWDPLLLQTFIYSTSQTFFSSLVKTSSKNLSQFPLIILCGDAPVSPNHLQNHVSHQLSVHCWPNFSMFSVKTVWQKKSVFVQLKTSVTMKTDSSIESRWTFDFVFLDTSYVSQVFQQKLRTWLEMPMTMPYLCCYIHEGPFYS